MTTSPLVDYSRALSSLAQSAAQSAVAVHGRSHGSSSGFLWRRGLVVTAHEALDRDDQLGVVLPDGTSVQATLVGRDPSTDIALLRVEEASERPALRPSAAELGEIVVAVGRSEDGPIAAFGIVGQSGPAWQSRQGGRIDALLRLDIALPGRAEGAIVVGPEGGFIGMAVFGPRRRVLVIPAATVERVASRILERGGTVGRGYLGVGLQPVAVGEEQGAIVLSLDEKGPARAGGVLQGDIIVGLNGEKVRGMRGLLSRLDPDSVGQTITLEVLRGGASTSLQVTVGERPSA